MDGKPSLCAEQRACHADVRFGRASDIRGEIDVRTSLQDRTDRRRRLRPERLAGAAALESGAQARARRPCAGRSRRSRERDRRHGICLRCLERGAGCKIVRRCRGRARRARCGDLQCQLPHPRRLHRAGARRCGEDDCGVCLRRVSGGASRRQTDAAEPARRDFLHRRVSQREGLCQVGAVRDGQVRIARTCRKASRANCSRRASMSPIS